MKTIYLSLEAFNLHSRYRCVNPDAASPILLQIQSPKLYTEQNNDPEDISMTQNFVLDKSLSIHRFGEREKKWFAPGILLSQ